MSNTFYHNACEVTTKSTPFPSEVERVILDTGTSDEAVNTTGLNFYTGKNSKIFMPHSIMNDNVAINYRTISNFYALQNNNKNFTDYNDYLKCIRKEDIYTQFLKDKRNPTYQNILKYYSQEGFDDEGLSRYKVQDFIYLKYFNKIPNNYMLTLRRYTRPCEDQMFGLDMNAQQMNALHSYSEKYFAIATAVTYMGEQTGNKMSDILKFDYGAKWEDKTAQVTSLQSSEGGLAAQLKERAGVNNNFLSAEQSEGLFSTASLKNAFALSAMAQGKGVNVANAMASQHNPYQENEFSAKYGDEFYGDVNVVDSTKARARGLTFSNSFSLTFEYSLKSLKCVNPRVAMMDILCNFLILTGNYGTFWGGATIFYGNRNIAPQYGDPSLLRKGKYGEYLSSLWRDVKTGFNNLGGKGKNNESQSTLETIMNVGKNLVSGAFTSLIGNIFGGNVGVAGQSQIPPALLSGAPTGYWHLTVGNPLDPIAMMGNMAVTKTTVQFNDILGYDDFPTEIKFTVDLEHCRPRDNAGIESMFNAGKGRFYTFTNNTIEKQYHYVDSTAWAQKGNNGGSQEVNTTFDKNSMPVATSNHTGQTNERIKILGGILNY